MMSFIQKYQHLGARTSLDLIPRYIAKFMQIKPVGCTLINLVGDRYDFPNQITLKGDERLRREKSKKSKEFSASDNLKIPNWLEMMRNQKNKANLLNYIASSMLMHPKMLPTDMTFILGGMMEDSGHTIILRNGISNIISDLSCEKHEEADTRIFAHLAYCVSNLRQTRAVILATDTDIIMLSCLHLFNLEELQEIWIQMTDKYIPIHNLVSSLAFKYDVTPKNLTSTLMVTYVLSGCDTVSYPYRRCKKRAAEIALGMIGKFPNILVFGDQHFSWDITPEIIEEARQYFVALYGHKSFISLDKLREYVFATTKSDIRVLPPTEDSFYFHVLKSLYQLTLNKRAPMSDPQLPPLTNFGRKLVNDQLQPIYMEMEARPDLSRKIRCKCTLSKCLKRCSCSNASVSCFAGCLCVGDKEKWGRIDSEDSLSESDDE